MSYILHIDTSGNEGTIALSEDGKILFTERNANARDHAASINLMVERILQAADIGIQQLSAISVCAGPGSYTGLRIGLATAKGYCYAYDIPLMLENRLTLLAYQFFEQLKREGKHIDLIITALVARENEYFFASYDGNFNIKTAPTHITEEDLLSVMESNSDNAYITGRLSAKSINSTYMHSGNYIDNESIDAEFWAKKSFDAYKCQKFVTLSSAEPFYLKQVFINKPLKNN
ncbi:tRNA (adenosine(37)-N6)-threonylcarbamoyltransferase complex dimerization subunit type 1 TsaB [Taibaiella soli]|nr:tRNA (adenosine(37)-N6)-threonylcarbamoyltransferase complex dimerization subunit type 1 TsaB [Taibaiella soli]